MGVKKKLMKNERKYSSLEALEIPKNFTTIYRLFNTTLDGNERIDLSLSRINGIGLQFSSLVCKRGGMDRSSRAGSLENASTEALLEIIKNPNHFNIPSWFLNCQKNYSDGKDYQLLTTSLTGSLRDNLDRLKKLRTNRGIRHYWGIRVRGQHTKNSGRGKGINHQKNNYVFHFLEQINKKK